jgi:hypothetical protein
MNRPEWWWELHTWLMTKNWWWRLRWLWWDTPLETAVAVFVVGLLASAFIRSLGELYRDYFPPATMGDVFDLSIFDGDEYTPGRSPPDSFTPR